MNGTTAIECPSQFALDDREIHGGRDPAIDRHLAECRRCEARLGARAAEKVAFDAGAAALWTRIAAAGQEARAKQGRWRLASVRLPALIVGVGVGAAALFVVARPFELRRSAYVAPKGQASVEIICRRGDAVFRLAPGDDVAPGDELRFRPLPVWPGGRFIQLGTVDGTGRYTPFYPSDAGAPSVPVPPGAEALAGSIRLDDAPGPERVFVVLSPAPLSETAVAEVAMAQATSGATVDRIQGAPVHTAWIVLRKRAEGPPAP
jgi:hypothetical protein